MGVEVRKRGRPKKVNTDDAIPTRNFAFDSDKTEKLLDLRLSKYREAFLNCKERKTLAGTWQKLALEFNLFFNTTATVVQLKNKFQAEKKLFQEIVSKQSATGNNTDEPIVLPKYWPVLVNYFGDRKGLAGENLGESDDMLAGIFENAPKQAYEGELLLDNCEDFLLSDGFLASMNTPTSCPTPLSNQECENFKSNMTFKSSSKKQKIDLGGAVASMADAIKEGLLAMASTKQDTTPPVGLSNVLEKINSGMETQMLIQQEMLKLLLEMKSKKE
jgi:hypothetical protein